MSHLQAMDNLSKFCNSADYAYLENIPKKYENLIVDYCYDILWQKYGNQQLAKDILLYFNKITTKSVPDIKFEVIINASYKNDTYSELIQNGITAIPIIKPEELKKYQKRFLETIENFPEYRRGSNKNLAANEKPLLYVAGGFGAFANPASFHNPLVRELRMKAYEKLKPIMRQLINSRIDKNLKNNWKFECLFDRMMYRLASQVPQKEAWHRDVLPPKLPETDDEVFGGWINLDSHNQYFSCIPGSHLGVKLTNISSGFDVLKSNIENKLRIAHKTELSKLANKKEVEIYVKTKVDKIYDQLVSDKFNTKFVVPPGHIVIFPPVYFT